MKHLKYYLKMGIIILMPVLTATTGLCQEESNSLPLIRKDVKVDFKAVIDLTTGEANYDYNIINIEQKPLSLEVMNPNFARAARPVLLGAQATERTELFGHVLPQKLSEHTSFATYRPYLIVGKTEETGRLLMSDHDVDISIKLPPGARMVKCSLPYAEQEGQYLNWQVKNLKAVPVIHLWYTTAPEQVEVNKITSDQGTEGAVSIDIVNKSDTDIHNISVWTQFPRSHYELLPDKSDGRFELKQGIMYDWRANIERLPRGAKKRISFRFRKSQCGMMFEAPEIVVYNSVGDIIAAD